MVRIWSTLLVLAVAVAVSVNLASAQEKKDKKKSGKTPTIEERFEKLDTNKDKKLSLDEFKAGPFSKKGGDPARIEKMFEKMDANGDKAIDLNEFKDFMKKMAERAKKGKKTEDKDKK